jgi:hypothetical protein
MKVQKHFLKNKQRTMTSIQVEVYSEKAIVVRNTLEHHGPILTALGGTFNDRLKGGRGWIFPKHMMSQVRSAIEKLNSGQYGNEYEQTASSAGAVKDMVSKAEYLSLLTRVERLEAIVAQLSPLCANPIAHAPIVSGPSVSVPSVMSSSSSAIKTAKIVIDPFEEPEVDDAPVEKNKRLVSLRK